MSSRIGAFDPTLTETQRHTVETATQRQLVDMRCEELTRLGEVDAQIDQSATTRFPHNRQARHLAKTLMTNTAKIANGIPIDPGAQSEADRHEAIAQDVERFCARIDARSSWATAIEHAEPFIKQIRSWADAVTNQGDSTGRYEREFYPPAGQSVTGQTVDYCIAPHGAGQMSPWDESRERAPIAVVIARQVQRRFDDSGLHADVKLDRIERHIIRGAYTLDDVALKIETGAIPTSCNLRLGTGRCEIVYGRENRIITLAFPRGELAILLHACTACLEDFCLFWKITDCRFQNPDETIG